MAAERENVRGMVRILCTDKVTDNEGPGKTNGSRNVYTTIRKRQTLLSGRAMRSFTVASYRDMACRVMHEV